jgi:hypothetical protein
MAKIGYDGVVQQKRDADIAWLAHLLRRQSALGSDAGSQAAAVAEDFDTRKWLSPTAARCIPIVAQSIESARVAVSLVGCQHIGAHCPSAGKSYLVAFECNHRLVST